ncbi:MAG: hypothetical protein HYY78_22450 [Betaproteobacteria bacterium]|nr:hypothetical protein [Betaproteobacteria bacterium]
MIWKTLAAAILLCSGAATAGAVGNLADVTIYDRAENRVLPVHRHDGRYYVVGRPGNEYQIRVRNRTVRDILAVVSVDGVNAVSGETADWNQTGYVLGRYQSFGIRGWRKTLERVAAFFFTEHANSYAARTGRPDHVGVIGVAVFRRQAEPEARINRSPPRTEPPASGAHDDSPYPASADAASEAGSGSDRSAESAAGPRHAPSRQAPRKSASLGTGHGRSVHSRVTYTSFERATASPEEVVAIHYDTHANLVAMGVIRAPRVALPSPFPGQFVPDPR